MSRYTLTIFLLLFIGSPALRTGAAPDLPRHRKADTKQSERLRPDGAYTGKIASAEDPSSERPTSRTSDQADQTSPRSNGFTTDMLVVSVLSLGVLVLFFWEPIRIDLIALSIPVILVILQQWTRIDADEALRGFASEATITVLAMFILSEGVRNTGLVQILGEKITEWTGDNEFRQVGVISGLTGTVAAIINNTPVVAIFVPMVTRIARKLKRSPSKLLLPISYAAMMGGTLTLLGTSTNLLASDISARLIDHPFSMFEFTQLGVVVFFFGFLYLVTLGRYLTPARIDPEEDLTEEYEMQEFLTEIIIDKGSELIGKTVGTTLQESELDMDVVQIVRSGKQFMEPLAEKTLRQGDHLIIRTDRHTLMKLLETEGLRLRPEKQVTENRLEEPVRGQKLIEAVITKGSFLEGETLADMNFLDRYDSTVLAVRRGEELTHNRMDELTLAAGDVLLLISTSDTLSRLRQNRNFIISREMEPTDYRWNQVPMVMAVLAAVILLAALDILPIVISALGGVVAMVLTGAVSPGELYDSVNWEVIFLLAGLIPLGIAIEDTGLAAYIAGRVLLVTGYLPPVMVLGIFYLLTVLLTNIISNNASVVLMIPVAVDAATKMGVEPFPFVLAVTFAASTAFLTPVGYQTNLMVYGPGGYRFSDFFRVGAPLQLLLTIVTPLGIAFFWPLT